LAYNGRMQQYERRKHRSIVRVRNRRSLRLLLLSLGLAGLAMGVGLLAAGPIMENPRFMKLGGLYILAALGVLAVRQAMIAFGQLQRQRHHRHHGGGGLAVGTPRADASAATRTARAAFPSASAPRRDGNDTAAG
jgi:hypothetical protein